MLRIMAAAYQKKIREKFLSPFFNQNSKGGTGLGLALTYGLIRDIYGSLEFESPWVWDDIYNNPSV